MDNFNIMGEGGFCFISHSHLDIEKVRKVRNILEEQGFDPLCFYLKCLTDDDEIEGLIKREIDAREIFIYLDSKNARNSKWVQKERAYIEEHKNEKQIRIVDIDNNENTENIAQNIMSSMRVFLSYSVADKKTVQPFKKALIEKDFMVFDYSRIRMGMDIIKEGMNKLYETAYKGCIMVFLSKQSVQSPFIKREIYMAYARDTLIVPIILEEVDLPEDIQSVLKNFQYVKLDVAASDEQVNKICNIVKEMLYNRYKRRILNDIANKMQLLLPKNIGVLIDELQTCHPSSLEEWQEYYYNHVHSKEDIIKLGKKLYDKISKLNYSDITEQDCIDYIIELVIEKAYRGYMVQKTNIKISFNTPLI